MKILPCTLAAARCLLRTSQLLLLLLPPRTLPAAFGLIAFASSAHHRTATTHMPFSAGEHFKAAAYKKVADAIDNFPEKITVSAARLSLSAFLSTVYSRRCDCFPEKITVTAARLSL